MLDAFYSFASFVEYMMFVNTVSNITVLYDHWKHIRFPHILVLLCCCHLYLDYVRSATFSGATSCLLHIPDI
jgi:hypothetical protein